MTASGRFTHYNGAVRASLNPHVKRDDTFRGLFDDAEYRGLHAYYASHPELVPTPLTPLRALAASLGVRACLVKDESRRDGVGAFKIMGVRYAVHRLGDDAAARGLVCATAGNHGRAVARVARDKGVACTVFVPRPRAAMHPAERATRDARVGGMRADGATVIEFDGTYEAAVRAAADFGAAQGATIVSDTSWPGYEELPRWIMAGYTQVFEEAYSQWDRPPDVVLVPGGVGGLVAAAASWLAWRFGANRPRLVACEPERAACLLASTAAGRPTPVEGSLDTIMAGLRCAEVSPAAWPAIRDGVDGHIAITDAQALDALERLSHPQDDDAAILAGPSGACAAGAAISLAQHPECAPLREAFGLDRSATLLAVVTEGP